jgi:hypothetical protein
MIAEPAFPVRLKEDLDFPILWSRERATIANHAMVRLHAWEAAINVE